MRSSQLYATSTSDWIISSTRDGTMDLGMLLHPNSLHVLSHTVLGSDPIGISECLRSTNYSCVPDSDLNWYVPAVCTPRSMQSWTMC